MCFSLSVGRRGRAGSGSVDSGGEERLHQPAELQFLLSLCLHPDSCRDRGDSDRGDWLRCHADGEEEPFDCGKKKKEK